MNEYWLTLNEDTFLWTKNEKGCIYNAKNQSVETFDNKGYLQKITTELLDIERLYTTDLNQEIICMPEVADFIAKVTTTNSGSLIENDGNNTKPVSFKPILKLQDGVDYYKWEHRQGIDGNIIKNLHELVFYINGSKYGNDYYQKQVIFPDTTEKVMNMHSLFRFASNARNPYLTKISLVGNIMALPKSSEIISELEKISTVEVVVTIQDVMDTREKAEKIARSNYLVILVTDYNLLQQLLSAENWAKDVSFRFVITSEADYKLAEQNIEQYKLGSYEVVPVYTKENHSFFANNLYLDKEILSDIALSKKDIFIRQTLNIHDFGKLHISPDGEIYGNLNNSCIGNIQETPKNIVYREITEGKSWLQIRNSQPCCDCIYQWICPSPSNYERVIGKMNLCKIND